MTKNKRIEYVPGQCEYKNCLPEMEVKVIDGDAGIVENIITVFGVLDKGNDISLPGSFSKTIVERGLKVLVLDQHRTDSTLNIVGKPLSLREIGRAELPLSIQKAYPEATGGVLATTQFFMDTPEGAGVFARIKAGGLREWSYGYDVIQQEYKTVDWRGEPVQARMLQQVRLYEYSPVLWGMAESATLSAKSATGATGLPLADRGRAWDSTAAEGRVRTWADATEAPNSKYRSAFFWYDNSAPDNFTSYKLQFADVVDGELTAIPRGIFAVAAVLQGSRGGVDIPAADQAAIKRRVAAYYARMRSEFDDENIAPPWEKADDEPAEDKAGRVLSSANVNRIRAAMTSLMETLSAAGVDMGDMMGAGDESTSEEDQPKELPAEETQPEQAGPVTPPTANDADILKLIEIEQNQLNLLEV